MWRLRARMPTPIATVTPLNNLLNNRTDHLLLCSKDTRLEDFIKIKAPLVRRKRPKVLKLLKDRRLYLYKLREARGILWQRLTRVAVPAKDPKRVHSNSKAQVPRPNAGNLTGCTSRRWKWRSTAGSLNRTKVSTLTAVNCSCLPFYLKGSPALLNLHSCLDQNALTAQFWVQILIAD